MRIELSGWRRFCGSWVIGKAELAALKEDVPSESYHPQKVYMYSEDGKVLVEQKAAGHLNLNGDYRVTLALSPEDIAAMARIAFRDMPFPTVVALLKDS